MMYSQPYPPQPPAPTLDAIQALSIAWKLFTKQWKPWVLAAVLFMIGLLMFILLCVVIMVATGNTASDGTFATSLLGSLSIFILSVCIIVGSIVFQAVAYRVAFEHTQGKKIDFSDFLNFKGIGTIILTMIVVELIVAVGSLLCLIPGLIASVLLIFASVAVIANPGMAIGDALKESVEVVKANLLQVIVLILVTGLIGSLASFTVIGIFVFAPFSYLVYNVAYLMATQRPIATPA